MHDILKEKNNIANSTERKTKKQKQINFLQYNMYECMHTYMNTYVYILF